MNYALNTLAHDIGKEKPHQYAWSGIQYIITDWGKLRTKYDDKDQQINDRLYKTP